MYFIRWTLLTVLLALTLAACTTTPKLDSTFGSAVNTAKAQQTINPNASRNADPVLGLDGTSAKTSIERYQESFQKPPPTFVILGTPVGQ